MKYLIINADDFGMSEEVNQGIKQGIKAGVINSVSVMVNMPYFDDAISFLRNHPEVSAGLHFNITEGSSILPPNDSGSMRREDNSFYHWTMLGSKLISGKVKAGEVTAELRAQYSKLKATGIPVSHIDSHHHIHLYPSIFKQMVEFASKEHIRMLRCRRFGLWSLTQGLKRAPNMKQLLIISLCLMNNIHSRGSSHLYDVNSIYDINWSDNYEVDHFLNVLKKVPEGVTEIICHPAVMSERGNKTFLEPRSKTLSLLLRPEIRSFIKAEGILLKHREVSSPAVKMALS